MLNKWDERFLRRAAELSGWSKDPSTGVGAVLVDPQNCARSEGFNGFSRKVRDLPERLNDRRIKYPLTLHAELNAVLLAQRDLTGFACYTWPAPPCAHCASVLSQVGIVRIVAPEPTADMRSRWEFDFKLASEIVYPESGMELVLVPMSTIDFTWRL